MRDITSDMAEELEGQYLRPLLMAEMYFDSATVYIWSGYGDLIWNANTYIGGGNLVGVSAIEESEDLEANGITCTLSGVPLDLISIALNEPTRQRPFRMYLACVDETPDSAGTTDPKALIASPYRCFTGLMDVMEISDNGQQAAIALSVESSLLIGQRTKNQYYTSVDQKATYPTDTGLDTINSLQDASIVW